MTAKASLEVANAIAKTIPYMLTKEAKRKAVKDMLELLRQGLK